MFLWTLICLASCFSFHQVASITIFGFIASNKFTKNMRTSFSTDSELLKDCLVLSISFYVSYFSSALIDLSSMLHVFYHHGFIGLSRTLILLSSSLLVIPFILFSDVTCVSCLTTAYDIYNHIGLMDCGFWEFSCHVVSFFIFITYKHFPNRCAVLLRHT